MPSPHLTPRADPALAVDRLTKRFSDWVAFQDVSFEVGHGEVFGFLGPNGAGKTTTVRTLGTLIAPTSGSATVAGIRLPGRTTVRHPRVSAVGLGWLIVSAMFDRERLMTGTGN